MASPETRESDLTEESYMGPSQLEAEIIALGVGEGEHVFPQELRQTSEVSAKTVDKHDGARMNDGATRCH